MPKMPKIIEADAGRRGALRLRQMRFCLEPPSSNPRPSHAQVSPEGFLYAGLEVRLR